jgi:hypothetical protein
MTSLMEKIKKEWLLILSSTSFVVLFCVGVILSDGDLWQTFNVAFFDWPTMIESVFSQRNPMPLWGIILVFLWMFSCLYLLFYIIRLATKHPRVKGFFDKENLIRVNLILGLFALLIYILKSCAIIE